MAAAKSKRKAKRDVEPAWRAPLLWAARVALVIAIGVAVWGSFRIRSHVRGDSRFAMAEWSIQFGKLPDWVTPEIRDDLEDVDLGALVGDGTLFDAGVLDVVREGIEVSPWVRKVDKIDLAYPTAKQRGALLLELTLARPVALVDTGGLFYLTDRDGRRLGEPYDTPPNDWFGVPTIVGLGIRAAVPEVGQPWESHVILNGVHVAVELYDRGIHEEFPTQPIEAIDVSNVDGRLTPHASEIVLIWRGRRLTWGRAPLNRMARTTSVDQVVENLRRVLERPTDFDAYEIHLHRRRMTAIREASARRPAADAIVPATQVY